MASSRVPCPQCGAMNFAQDPVCLGCGRRFAPAVAAARAPAGPTLAPDEMCLRCFSVLLPAAQFDTRNMGGSGTSDGVSMRFVGGVGGPAGAARGAGAAFGLMDLLANLLLGAILKKNFDRRLRAALIEAPHSLCCPSCRTIYRR